MKGSLAWTAAVTLFFGCASRTVSRSTPPPSPDVIQIGGARITIDASETVPPLTHADLVSWITAGATNATRYFGGAPGTEITVFVDAQGRGRGIEGRTFPGRIYMEVGRNTTRSDLDDDWEFTHEWVHLSFPEVGESMLWMHEGLATWLEPVIRVRAGVIDREEFWRGVLEGMPNGIPSRNAGGLDGTGAWGRLYWGGAAFWMLADLDIRRETHGTKSLDDALRAILAESGGMAARRDATAVFHTGDVATGTTALTDLYAKMGKHRHAPDLDALWKDLGISRGADGHLVYRDDAPLAAARDAITNRSP